MRNDAWGGSGRTYALLAPETLDPTLEADLYYFIVDSTFKTISSTPLTISAA